MKGVSRLNKQNGRNFVTSMVKSMPKIKILYRNDAQFSIQFSYFQLFLNSIKINAKPFKNIL